MVVGAVAPSSGLRLWGGVEDGCGCGGPIKWAAVKGWGMQVRRQNAEHEALQVRLCCLLARECAAGNLAVSPGWVRTSLLDALKVLHFAWLPPTTTYD